MCLKAFSKLSALKTHSAIHSDKRSFKCDFEGCDITFNLGQSLKRHQIAHRGLKPFKCGICETCFSATKGLQSHIQKVHKNERLHSCLQCDKSYVKSWDLKKHSNVHNEEKLFKCQICETSLKSSAGLIVHMRSHSGEKPFRCKICGQDFNQDSNMRKHLKRIHLKPHLKDNWPSYL